MKLSLHLFLFSVLLPGILAQGGQMLETYEELAAALELGHHVSAIFDAQNCDADFPPAFTPRVVVPMDPWTRIQLEDGSEDYITFNHDFIFYDGNFLLVTGYVDDIGRAAFTIYEISGSNGSIVETTVAECVMNVGAFFVQKRFTFPEDHVTTYDDLKSLLLGGTHVTFLGLAELCEGNPTTGLSKAQGGSYHLQFYVEINPTTGEEDLILEYYYLGITMDASTPTFNVVRMRVYPDGFVNVTGSAFLTTTWEDEYPFPQGFQCTLDDGARFQYRQQEDYDVYGTFAEAEAALLEGKELQVSLDHTQCVGAPDVVTAVGVRLLEWRQFDVDSAVGHVIAFTQLYSASTGSIALQEYAMTDDDQLWNHVTVFNPVTDEILYNTTYSCPLGTGAIVSAPARNSRPLDNYDQLLETAMDGLHMEVRINIDQCNDPTGSGMNFTGVTAGAYLREMVIINPDSPDSSIFTAAYALVTNYMTGEGFAYSSVDITLNSTNVAAVVPALWSVENGQLTNLLGEGFFLECGLGDGLIIYSSRQD
ncbi:unnamed protein product [Darwinula stevensoni]|uniref:Uncharacterized protein n=1 Tax=Darwinula stevensoni TaxID=69355 RepID=A0A7R9AAV7_9CRUS|nr:unnamed protein product [Darwinula stevensoni]CAG0898650.1 unnamed protein product [Darwinula stevensoni]